MAYDRTSPQALLGDWAEAVVIARAIAAGWHVLHDANVGPGATMVQGRSGKVVMPDLQLLDLAHNRGTRFVEVKAKRGAYRWQKGQCDCTGIDRVRYEHYQRLTASGIPVDLAIIHMHQPLRFSSLIEPSLLWQTIAVLADRNPMSLVHGDLDLIVWDVRAFICRGNLPNPPPDIVAALRAIHANLRIWEREPKLRDPDEMPRQGKLDL